MMDKIVSQTNKHSKRSLEKSTKGLCIKMNRSLSSLNRLGNKVNNIYSDIKLSEVNKNKLDKKVKMWAIEEFNQMFRHDFGKDKESDKKAANLNNHNH